MDNILYNKVILQFLSVYVDEAMGQEVDTASGDITPLDILLSLFENKDKAEQIYIEGKNLSQGDKAKAKRLFFDLESVKWTHAKQGIPLFSLAVLINDWNFANRINPYERAKKAGNTN